MSFTLYVWGPAFGLPSLDAECIAAIAYLRAVFHGQSELWRIIESHDPSASPTGSFPLLQHVETKAHLGGFSTIVAYLAEHGHSIDTHLPARKKADCIALTTHLSTHAPPLLSAHLYTSPTTYSHTTHPAITHLLPHHALSYTTPSALRTRATALAASAGLDSTSGTEASGGDAGVTSADAADKQLASSSNPSLVFRRRQTLAATLRGEESKSRFRIEGALERLAGVLDEVLGQDEKCMRGEDAEGTGRATGKRWLVTAEKPTSADCLALGYLALLLYPPVPDSFLATTLRKRYPAVASYIEWACSELLDPPTTTQTQGHHAELSTPSAIPQILTHTLHTHLLSHNLVSARHILTDTSAGHPPAQPLPLLPTSPAMAALLAPVLTLPLLLGLGYTTRPLWQNLWYDVWFSWRGYSFDYFDPWGGWKGWGGGEGDKVFERQEPISRGSNDGGGVDDMAFEALAGAERS